MAIPTAILKSSHSRPPTSHAHLFSEIYILNLNTSLKTPVLIQSAKYNRFQSYENFKPIFRQLVPVFAQNLPKGLKQSANESVSNMHNNNILHVQDKKKKKISVRVALTKARPFNKFSQYCNLLYFAFLPLRK